MAMVSFDIEIKFTSTNYIRKKSNRSCSRVGFTWKKTYIISFFKHTSRITVREFSSNSISNARIGASGVQDLNIDGWVDTNSVSIMLNRYIFIARIAFPTGIKITFYVGYKEVEKYSVIIVFVVNALYLNAFSYRYKLYK